MDVAVDMHMYATCVYIFFNLLADVLLSGSFTSASGVHPAGSQESAAAISDATLRKPFLACLSSVVSPSATGGLSTEERSDFPLLFFVFPHAIRSLPLLWLLFGADPDGARADPL